MITGLITAVMGVTLLAGTASARPNSPAQSDSVTDDDPGVVQVVKVSGLLDPIVVSFIADEIEAADEAGLVALVLQINSEGAAVGDDEIDDLVAAIADADITIGAWVGPSGSKAEEEATRLVAAADVSALTPGSRIEVTSEIVDAGDVDLDGKASIGEKVGSETAAELGLVDSTAPILGDFVIGLPGFQTEATDDGLQPLTQVRFGQLGLVDQLFHTVASPAVAYLLLIIGGCLLVFELFTAGVGVAGMVGVGSLILAAYGLAVLPTNTWALVALCACFPAFAVDVQTGVPRFWTGVGSVGLVLGSLFVFADGPPSWITLIAGIGGTLLSMLGGMPAMVRTRFSTPTIGRDWMIGESGIAVADVSPDGIVTVRDAPWRAHTNRATPIAAGDTVTVTAIDGLVLEVEPVEGGAKDYRERH